MLLVLIHHALILAIAMVVLGQLVWRAQVIREPGKIDDKSMQVLPRWSYTICKPGIRPLKRHGFNTAVPAILTSLIGSAGCLLFIVAKTYQPQSWFNIVIDAAIVLVGVTATHVFRYYDPDPFIVDSKQIHRQAYPSNLYIGLLCATVGGSVSYYFQPGSNLAVCLIALGCGHAGLLFMRPLPKLRNSNRGTGGLRPERT